MDFRLKKAMDVFAEEGLKFFGIDKKVKDASSTEIVVLGEMLVEDGIKKGEEKKAIEIAKTAIKEGMTDELIAKITGLTESQVSIIRQSISN